VCFTCGTCAGAWAMPYSDERIYYGRLKAKQLRGTGATMVVAPCHNCRDQLMKSLNKE
jgi:Fe-S oxidoreductase